MTVRRSLRVLSRFVLLVSICALPLSAAESTSKGIAPDGTKFKCNTKAPTAMLDGEPPDKHEFIEAPENRATESATLADGTKLGLEVAGCHGAQTTSITVTLAKQSAPADGTKSHGALVNFFAAHPDALSKTPLVQPGPARALRAIDEGRLAYSAGDKLCFDKDDAAVIDATQKCTHSMTLTWTGASFKTATVFSFRYQLGQ